MNMEYGRFDLVWYTTTNCAIFESAQHERELHNSKCTTAAATLAPSADATRRVDHSTMWHTLLEKTPDRSQVSLTCNKHHTKLGAQIHWTSF